MASNKDALSGVIPDLAKLVPRAPATFLIAFACVGVFARLRIDGAPETAADWERWGVVALDRTLGAKGWGLLSCTLVHVAPLHLLFNLWWSWELGVRLETWLGTWKYVGLVLASAAISSWMQGVAGETLGHGYSGVNYALFGFAWAARPRRPELGDVIHPRNVTLMVAWLAGCFVATELGYAHIGNAAHASGLAFGGLLAFALVRKRIWAHAGLAALVAACVVGAYWRPWSPYWSGQRAWAAHVRGDLDVAEAYYRTARRVGLDEMYVARCLTHLHAVAGDDEGYRESFEALRALDPAAAKPFEDFRAQLAESREYARGREGAPDAEYWKGRVAALEWRYGDARRHFTAQLRSNPADVAALCGRASAVLEDPDAGPDDFAQACADALAAVEASKRRDVDALSLAADALRRSGEPESARDLVREAEALLRRGEPHSERARKRLESLGLGQG